MCFFFHSRVGCPFKKVPSTTKLAESKFSNTSRLEQILSGCIFLEITKKNVSDLKVYSSAVSSTSAAYIKSDMFLHKKTLSIRNECTLIKHISICDILMHCFCFVF